MSIAKTHTTIGRARATYQHAQSHILSARDLGIEQAISGKPYDPPIWVRGNPLFQIAYTRGFNSVSSITRRSTPVIL